MKRYLDMLLGYIVSGVFIVGGYAIAHYMVGLEDRTILIFLLAYWWGDMAKFLNKPETETAK